MNISGKEKNQMMNIIKNKEIKSVFQPIVSLKNGSVLGYEALSRITAKRCTFSINEAFAVARGLNCLWDFERLCRVASIKAAADKPKTAKLFLNVTPDILTDSAFKSGVTYEKLEKYHIDCNDLVFEASEHFAIEDSTIFQDLLAHYREQGFRIAVDNVSSGLSGINHIFDASPQYIKIGIDIIRNIETDEMDRSFISALSQLAENSGIYLIAVGIETYGQMKAAIELGIDYGQGFYFAKPSEEFEKISSKIRQKIIRLSNEQDRLKLTHSCFSTVRELCSKMPVLSPDALFSDVYEIMSDPHITESAIVDENGSFLGILTRRQVLQSMSGMYGYTLHARKSVVDVMDASCLTITPDTPVETAAKMAMARCQPYTYDSIPMVDGKTQKYFGFVSIKDLLLSAVNIQVKRATDCNPLTGLPGNHMIDEKIEGLIGNKEPFAIIYFDLDNFKAYNDAYGFSNGDLMIKAVSEILTSVSLRDDFCGHVGGDDFVMITKGDRTEKLCEEIFEKFVQRSRSLYSREDCERGYIVSKNRKGLVENFPLASLSAAAITNRNKNFDSIQELSLVIAKTKKQAKQSTGNSLIIA